MAASRTLDDAARRRIRQRHEAGEALRAIAVELGIGYRTAVRAVLVAGGEVPDTPFVREVRRQLAKQYGRVRGPDGHVNEEGYRLVLVDEGDPFFGMAYKGNGGSTRPILEHRLVLARVLGRALLPHETVHHKNGDKLDNRPENLELRVGRHGRGASEAHCATCSCFRH